MQLNVLSGVTLSAVSIIVSSFVNPYSTHALPVSVSMINAGVTRSVESALSIGLSPSLMASSSIVSTSGVFANPEAQLIVTFQSKKVLLPTGQIGFYIPLWNP